MNEMKRIMKRIASGALAMFLLLPAFAEAAYHASSDTGVEALDYIENNRRTERENRLTDEQKQLLADAEAMREHLRRPLDTAQPSPIAVEGDDLTYDESTGAFTAKGKVHILQLEARRFLGEDISGNTKEQTIRIPGKAHMLQMTPKLARVTLDGYETNYNYGTKTGTMGEAAGKIDRYYVTGKRFEFYPDHYVVYNGTATKCGAKKPDYHWSADKMTVYPNDKIVMEKMKFWIKGHVFYKRDRYVANINPKKQDNAVLPRVGYDSDDGVSIEYGLQAPLAKNVTANANLHIVQHGGWRSNYDVTWANHKMRTAIVYGHFEDGNSKWIRREPAFLWSYGEHITGTPLYYSLGFEHGRWYQPSSGIHSTHTEYDFGLGHDPIKLGTYTIYLHTGYEITKESYDDSTVNGMTADAVLTKDFDARWASYAGFHYSKKNSKNSLFDYDTDDFSKKLEGGFSYRLDAKNRFVVGTRYNLDDGKWDDVDYYWYHDMHCSELILRYRSMRNTWGIRWDFTPW